MTNSQLPTHLQSNNNDPAQNQQVTSQQVANEPVYVQQESVEQVNSKSVQPQTADSEATLNDSHQNSPVTHIDNQHQVKEHENGVKETSREHPVKPVQNISAPLVNPSELQAQRMTLEDVLKIAIAQNASDVHISVGYRAMVRVDGTLHSLQSNILSNEEVRVFVEQLVQERHGVNIDTIEQIDLSYEFMNTRFRVNIFKEMGNYSIVLRLISAEIKTVEELDLPPIIKQIGTLAHGLVLVTGPTGSGKSTTIASILNMINLTQPRHIITLEDPVEYVFPNGVGLVDQREYGIDFSEWPLALKSALRQDPDVVLVGEMRDFETIASTITLSETGHLVFATLHTNSAAQSIDRIIDVFPSAQQSQIRAQLANVISAVVSQRLVPIQGGGRKAALEIMIATTGIRSAIREGKAHQIDNMIQTGLELGMITMEQSLVNLIKSGQISLEQAQAISSKPDQIQLLLDGQA